MRFNVMYPLKIECNLYVTVSNLDKGENRKYLDNKQFSYGIAAQQNTPKSTVRKNFFKVSINPLIQLPKKE